MIEAVTLNNELRDRYTAFLAGRSDVRFGHDLAWANTLHDTYGVETEHLVALENDRIVGICPFFLCKPIIGDAHYLTNPFPTYCGPIYNSVDALNVLLRKVTEKTSNVDHAEVLTPISLLNVEAGLLPFEEGLDYTFKLSL